MPSGGRLHDRRKHLSIAVRQRGDFSPGAVIFRQCFRLFQKFIPDGQEIRSPVILPENVAMSLEQTNTVDAVGLEIETGHIVLTIADSWDWIDEHGHLSALQGKLNAYFEFIESGQVWETDAAAKGGPLRINVVFRFSPPVVAIEFLAIAAHAAVELEVLVSYGTFGDMGCEI